MRNREVTVIDDLDLRSKIGILDRRAVYLEKRMAQPGQEYRAQYDAPEVEALRVAVTALRIKNNSDVLRDALKRLTRVVEDTLDESDDTELDQAIKQALNALDQTRE